MKKLIDSKLPKTLTVVIQAGGRGSRLRHHTWNKPKCLVSIRGKPLLYHTFDYFKNANFIIIGDYLHDQIIRYMEANPIGKPYKLLKATGNGTLSGIRQAFSEIEQNGPVLLIWGDIIIRDLHALDLLTKPTVFTTSAFACRWSVGSDKIMHEKPSSQSGIPGIFYFPQVDWLRDLPEEGEFVKWFAANKFGHEFLPADDIEELGDFSRVEIENDRIGFCRFFNSVEISDDLVVKKLIDPKFFDVHENEKKWYQEVTNIGFRRIPKILTYSPLTMERIKGDHLFDIKNLTFREQRAVLTDYLDTLIDLHDKVKSPVVLEHLMTVYVDKTLSRIKDVGDLIPYSAKRHMTINGLKCRNFFHEDFRHIFSELLPLLIPAEFTVIHGDPTFSNAIIDKNLRVKFIDPRGYFAEPGLHGDPWYDFSKVYYSAVGGYDAFNRRKFKLFVDDQTVEILQEETPFKRVSEDIFFEYFGNDLNRIRIIHSLIWFSFSGYVRDDIDSMIGAYSLGNYWLEKALIDMEGF